MPIPEEVAEGVAPLGLTMGAGRPLLFDGGNEAAMISAAVLRLQHRRLELTKGLYGGISLGLELPARARG